MGSMRRQSTQVTAKNSMKSKSFCLGTNFGVAVWLGKAVLMGLIVDTASEGIVGATEFVACGELHANNTMETKKIKKLSLRIAQRAVT